MIFPYTLLGERRLNTPQDYFEFALFLVIGIARVHPRKL